MSTILKDPRRAKSAESDGSKLVPPLQNGDRLTRAEFERRYEAMPDVKAELLEGVVYLMSSPVSHDFHGSPHFDFVTWMGLYKAATPGVDGGDNSSLRLDADNEPQSDAFLRILPEFGGQTKTSKDGYIEGGPELIAEIAASSSSIDLGVKKHVYRRTGVKEYIVWRVYDRAVDWFVLNEGEYERMQPGEDGIYRSRIFPGLWLDPKALLAGDSGQVVKVLQQGLASPEHEAFVKSLEAAKPKDK